MRLNGKFCRTFYSNIWLLLLTKNIIKRRILDISCFLSYKITTHLLPPNFSCLRSSLKLRSVVIRRVLWHETPAPSTRHLSSIRASEEIHSNYSDQRISSNPAWWLCVLPTTTAMNQRIYHVSPRYKHPGDSSFRFYEIVFVLKIYYLAKVRNFPYLYS